MSKRFLIKCNHIHIGDILFASSVAKKLNEEQGPCSVHFSVNYLQPIELLNNNPYIDKVFFNESFGTYDEVFNLIGDTDTLTPYESAVSQFQRMCNIKNFDDTFEIYTNPSLDYSISESFRELVKIGDWPNSLIKVGYQCDWDKKSFLFTEEQYERAEHGEDGTGYGDGSRNVYDIINCLEINPNIMLFALGLDDKISKRYPAINSTSKFTFTASLIKNCDFVIGAEGCLTNISSALGVKTIITTDYIHQMFGPKGIKWQQEGGDLNNLECRKPFLGPCNYFPKADHTHLNPYLTDQQVGEEILKVVTHGR